MKRLLNRFYVLTWKSKCKGAHILRADWIKFKWSNQIYHSYLSRRWRSTVSTRQEARLKLREEPLHVSRFQTELLPKAEVKWKQCSSFPAFFFFSMKMPYSPKLEALRSVYVNILLPVPLLSFFKTETLSYPALSFAHKKRLEIKN